MATDRQYQYSGSGLLSPLADRIQIPIDQVNFVASELLALAFSVCYRLYLRPSDVGSSARHAVAAGVGLVLGFFCFGNQMFHMFVQAGICYCIMKFSPPHLKHKLVFVFAMAYLAFMHIKRMSYDYGGYVLDVTGPMMISTQKVTSVAFSLHDGVHKKREKLLADQERHAIRRMPSILEYVSYVFHFQGLLAGPLCFYRDYIDFIDGDNISKCAGSEHRPADAEEPNPTGAVIQKLLFAGLCLFITLFITPYALKVTNADPEFIQSHSFAYRFVFMLVSVTLSRPKYYFAWKFAEAINNAAGFGFNGYDDRGRAKWDLVKNVSVQQLETATSLKVLIESWNIQTAIWLRRICYDRVRVQRTALTYVLSAIWHGFYPGYYLAFLGAAFFTPAARAVRRNIRPYFLTSVHKKQFYDCVTWFFAQLTLAYLIIPFTVLQFWPCFNFYSYSMYWWMHVLVGIALLALPAKSSSRSQVKDSDKTKVTNIDNNQVHNEDKAKQQ